jgi:hypothetical protein
MKQDNVFFSDFNQAFCAEHRCIIFLCFVSSFFVLATNAFVVLLIEQITSCYRACIFIDFLVNISHVHEIISLLLNADRFAAVRIVL